MSAHESEGNTSNEIEIRNHKKQCRLAVAKVREKKEQKQTKRTESCSSVHSVSSCLKCMRQALPISVLCAALS